MLTHLLKEPGIERQILCSLLGSVVAVIGGPLFGYNSVGVPSFERDPNAPFVLTQGEKSLFASIIAIGAILGSLCSGWLTELAGRRNLLAALLPPCSAAWLTIALATNFAMFLAARLVLGTAMGIAMPIGNIYLAETASPNVRGFISSSTMAWQVLYTLLNYILGLFLDWKALALVNGAIVWLYFPLVFLVPESPTGLLMKGDADGAEKAVSYIRGVTKYSGDAARDGVKLQVQKMVAHLEDTSKTRAKLTDVLEWNYLRSVLVLSTFVGLRQWTGMYAVLAYTVDIFRSVAESSSSGEDGDKLSSGAEQQQARGPAISPEVSTIIIGVIHLVFIIVSTLLMDKVGRRALITGSVLVMGLGHCLLGLYCWLASSDPDLARNLSWLPLASLNVFVVAFSLGIASSLFVLMGELVPVRIRNQATGLSAIANHVSLFAVLNFYYPMKAAMTEAGVFWFYGAVCFLLGAFSLLVLPETKGRSLEELERSITAKRQTTLVDGNDVVSVAKSDSVRANSVAGFDNAVFVPDSAIVTKGNVV